MLSTLTHGLPHLMIPQGADQYVNAKVCLKAGVAHRLLPDELVDVEAAFRLLSRSLDHLIGDRCALCRMAVDALCHGSRSLRVLGPKGHGVDDQLPPSAVVRTTSSRKFPARFGPITSQRSDSSPRESATIG
ncbi:MAG: hypothetical protein JWL97_3997 [Gemmatimonadales bacterium]|nr:hypothetical protein [Gemmatimonadales bacterium]